MLLCVASVGDSLVSKMMVLVALFLLENTLFSGESYKHLLTRLIVVNV
jgi:hypothetical protein